MVIQCRAYEILGIILLHEVLRRIEFILKL